MSYIYGFLFNIVTFPGQIFRVLAYRLMCDLLKVKVYDVNYFKGILVHGSVANLRKAFLISIAPLFLNTLLCVVLTFPAVFPFLIGDFLRYLAYIFSLARIELRCARFPSKKGHKVIYRRSRWSAERWSFLCALPNVCIYYDLRKFLTVFLV